MGRHPSPAIALAVAGAVIATISACQHAPASTALRPAPARISEADSGRAARRHADSVARAANERAARALKAHEDSINAREDSLRTKVAAARATLFAAVHFDDGSAAIRTADQPTLNRKVAIIAKNPGLRLRVFGYSNDRGSPDATQKLAADRALAVRLYLIAHGADSARVSVQSFGSARAICTAKNESCQAQNRRDEFGILAGGGEIAP